MFTTTTIVLVVCVYMALLFGLAQLLENRANNLGKKTLHPLVYALAITIYCTSWTFYGSVGFAAESGLLYIAIYLGAIGAILAWPHTLKRMVHAKETYHITSIADFISTRYHRSQTIAALVTIIALLGTIPYIALQLKAVITSFELIAVPSADVSYDGLMSGLLITLAMALFTIMFGARRLDPTERHVGMMGVLAVQCVIKLVAFLAVGIFVTFNLYDGFGDLIGRFSYAGLSYLISSDIPQGSLFMHWVTLILLGAASIQLLPRQFHVAVIENSSDQHIRTAMWLVPVYLVLISMFVIPVAAAGLLEGLFTRDADSFVLMLPQLFGHQGLTMLVFIGGFSAATGMIIISTMTLSTMATNHLLMVLIEKIPVFSGLRQHLLYCRWLLILGILLLSYSFAREFANSYVLVSMGTISFAAVFQFVPAIIGALFWSKGNKGGALMGLMAGFTLWLYTLVLPAFIKHGWFPIEWLYEGIWGQSWLRPEALFGLDGLSPLSHSVFWATLFNVAFYLFGSWFHSPSKEERTQLADFMNVMRTGLKAHRTRPTGLDAYILLADKKREANALLSEYLSQDKAEQAVIGITEDLMVSHKEYLNIVELVEFHRLLESVLSGAIGAASAHHAIESNIRYSERENQDLHTVYNHLVSEIQGHISRQRPVKKEEDVENSSRYSFIDDLQSTIDDQTAQLSEQQQKLKQLQSSLDTISQKLFDQRLENQKLGQENQRLRQKVSDLEENPELS